MLKELRLHGKKLLQVSMLAGSLAVTIFVSSNVQAAEELKASVVSLQTGGNVSHGDTNIETYTANYPVAGAIKELTKFYIHYNEEGQLEEVEANEDLIVTEVAYTKYVTDILNVRAYPNTDAEVLGKLVAGNKIEVIGEVENNDFVQIMFNDEIAYIHSDYLSDEQPKETQVVNYTWPGAVLNKLDGVAWGPSGKETYYNLDMSKVVSNMQAEGYMGEYWVRSDGAKMFGDYIMVAADLNIHPRGSLVNTSMGMGIVVDTGDFIYSDPNQIDVATTW